MRRPAAAMMEERIVIEASTCCRLALGTRIDRGDSIEVFFEIEVSPVAILFCYRMATGDGSFRFVSFRYGIQIFDSYRLFPRIIIVWVKVALPWLSWGIDDSCKIMQALSTGA